jgi:hypothetical protein
MKYHKHGETEHPALEGYHEKRLMLHGKSLPENAIHNYEANGLMNFTSAPQMPKPVAKRSIITHDAEAIYKKLQEIRLNECTSLKQSIISLSFLLLFCLAIGSSIFIFFISSNWKAYFNKVFKEHGLKVSDSSLSLMVTFGALANSFARLSMGFLLIKVKLRIILIFMSSVVSVAAFTFLSLMKSYGWGVAYMMVVWMMYGVVVSSLPSLSIQVFGANYGTKVYPVFFLAFRVSSFGQFFLYSFYGKTDESGMMFYLFGSMAVCAIIIASLMNFNPVWQKSSVAPKDDLATFPGETERHLETARDSDTPSKKPINGVSSLEVVDRPEKPNNNTTTGTHPSDPHLNFQSMTAMKNE